MNFESTGIKVSEQHPLKKRASELWRMGGKAKEAGCHWAAMAYVSRSLHEPQSTFNYYMDLSLMLKNRANDWFEKAFELEQQIKIQQR